MSTSTAALLSLFVHAVVLPVWVLAVIGEQDAHESPAPAAVRTVLVRLQVEAASRPPVEPTPRPRLEQPTTEMPEPVPHELPDALETDTPRRAPQPMPTWDTPVALVEVRARRQADPSQDPPAVDRTEEPVPTVDAPSPPAVAEAEQVTVVAPLPGPDNPPPRYPSVARRHGWEGLVVVFVSVNADGTVRRARVRTSSGHGVLDRAALEAVERWHFEPATRDETPIAGETTVAIRFEFED